jgi:hypothetical protein
MGIVLIVGIPTVNTRSKIVHTTAASVITAMVLSEVIYTITSMTTVVTMDTASGTILTTVLITVTELHICTTMEG